jgi:hypothetical protein
MNTTKNNKVSKFGLVILLIMTLLIVSLTVRFFSHGGKNPSLEIELPNNICDIWVTANGKKAEELKIKKGDKLEIGYDFSPQLDCDTKMKMTLDKEYSDILSLKSNVITAISHGKATVTITVHFDGAVSGKKVLTLPISVVSKNGEDDSEENSSNNGQSNIIINENSTVDVCVACGAEKTNPDDHALYTCKNHLKCEVGENTGAHRLAGCRQHPICDGQVHAPNNCYEHYSCDKDFYILPCGHCSCQIPTHFICPYCEALLCDKTPDHNCQ